MANDARFYVAENLRYNAKIILTETSIICHFVAVRIKPGDLVTLFNGDGYNYNCLVTVLKKKFIELEVQSRTVNNNFLPASLHLMMAIIQKDNFEWVIQKAVEMGVTHITPVNTDFSQRIDKHRIADRIVRWQQIAVSAAEQSGRSRITKVNIPLDLTEIIDGIVSTGDLGRTVNLVSSLHGADNIINIDFNHYEDISLLVGPEGGFSTKELNSLVGPNRFTPVHLGKGILRAETAATVAIGCIMLKINEVEFHEC